MSALVYYTHNSLPAAFLRPIYERSRDIARELGHQWVAVCREAFEPTDIVAPVMDGLPNYADIYRRVIAGLDAVAGEGDTMVYLVEHDVLYCKEHFQQKGRGPEVFYNLNLAYMCSRGYYRWLEGAIALSQLCGTKFAMRLAMRTKLCECLEARLACVEPAGRGYITGTFRTEMANIDIRTGFNATWKTPDDVKILDSLPGWAPWRAMWDRYSGGLPGGN